MKRWDWRSVNYTIDRFDFSKDDDCQRFQSFIEFWLPMREAAEEEQERIKKMLTEDLFCCSKEKK